MASRALPRIEAGHCLPSPPTTTSSAAYLTGKMYPASLYLTPNLFLFFYVSVTPTSLFLSSSGLESNSPIRCNPLCVQRMWLTWTVSVVVVRPALHRLLWGVIAPLSEPLSGLSSQSFSGIFATSKIPHLTMTRTQECFLYKIDTLIPK